jgi:hypothetical protein
MNFSQLYNKTISDLNLVLEQDLEPANMEPIVSQEEAPEAKVSQEVSELDKSEQDAEKVTWIEKIIKLLTLLNREDKNVSDIITNLAKDDTNISNLDNKIKLINDLLLSVSPARQE